MEMYFLKSAACLAVLLLFYKLLLENENMHVFKRFYLLTSVLAALLIPFVTFTTYVEPAPGNLNTLVLSSEASSEVAAGKVDLSYIFFGIYLLGVLFFSIKFCRNLRSLIIKIRTNPRVRAGSFINVLLSEKVQPHTFFSFIFFNKEKYLKEEIPQDVKIHEEAHARQKHSFDVLFIELLQIIFWFNPLIFLLKDAVKLNHEFLADREVIKKGINTSRYQQTLLAYSSGDLQSDLVNPINYSSIKKRFTVMKTQTSKKAIWARSLMLIPLIAGLVYSCSSENIVELDSTEPAAVQEQNTLELSVDENGAIFMNSKKTSISELQEIKKGKYSSTSINASIEAPQASVDELVEVIRTKGVRTISICSPGDRNFMNSGSPLNDKEAATPEMIAEYNKLVKHYNSLPKDERRVKQEDANRIMSILSRMTPEQKAKAEKINFDVPPPPPPAPAASAVDEYNKLVQHYNALPKDKLRVKQEDANRIMSILSRMTPEQKAKAEKINFNVPPPPPPPPAPVSAPEASKSDSGIEIKPPATPAISLPIIIRVEENTPPPPPPPPTFADLVEKGATFYYNGNKIAPEEARKLVEVEKKVNVQITTIEGKPEVRLTDKE